MAHAPVKDAPSGITLFLATACGLIVANIYYSQPLAGPIREALGLTPAAAGVIVTMTQVGYGLGLLLIVPLGDLFENRRLVLGVVGLAILALLGAAFAPGATVFLAASFLIGVGSVAVQILVPYASHLVPEAVRGRMVGNVMSGLMLGIMLARPVASLIAHVSSWRVVFVFSAGVMVVLCVAMARVLPARVPLSRLHYGELLASMGRLAATVPLLRRRALYHACLFGAFSLFWTVTPLLLAGPAYGLSQAGIALFALAGVAGAISAPLAGRAADRGWTRPATGLAMLLAAAAFVMTHVARAGVPPGTRAPGRGGDRPRLRRLGERRPGAAGPLHARGRIPEPPQRPLHGDLLHGRRGRLRPRRLGLCAGGLGPRLARRHRPARPGAPLFRHGGAGGKGHAFPVTRFSIPRRIT